MEEKNDALALNAFQFSLSNDFYECFDFYVFSFIDE